MTVGYEGVGPKKPRIQLKIAPSSEGKEGTSPVQGTSDSMSGQGKKGQAKTIIAEISEGKPRFISRTEWIEATKPLQHLVCICYTRSVNRRNILIVA